MLSIKRIFLLTGALAALLLALAEARVLAFQASVDASDATSRQRYQSYLLANELRQSSDDLTRLARTYVVTGDGAYETEYFHILDVRSGKSARPDGRTVALTALMKEAGFTEAEFSKLSEAQANSNALVKTETIAMNAVKGLYEDGAGQFTRRGEPDLDRARKMMHDRTYHANKAFIMRPIDEFFTLLDERTSQAVATTQAQRNAISRSVVVLVVATLTSLGLALYLAYRWIIGKLGGEPVQAHAIASDIAAGKLETQVHLRAGDSTSVVASMKTMQDRLRSVVMQIRDSAHAIDSASSEIATANHDLSSRTTAQAASVEETAAAIEELSSTVRQNADNAGQANKLVISASDVAAKGGKVVAEVVHTMGSIAESSRKISDIVSVIDGLAFQTNILALNAAVEAARAGQQGLGFAVVAAEVRSLSQRSAEAAKDIKSLIDDSVSKVEAGSVLVGNAGKAMDEIVGSVDRVTNIMQEIAAATQEQSTGLAQVNRAIVQIDQSTQQNAALVEQATASAEAMRAQAGSLTAAVTTFDLGDGARPVVTTAASSVHRLAPASRSRSNQAKKTRTRVAA